MCDLPEIFFWLKTKINLPFLLLLLFFIDEQQNNKFKIQKITIFTQSWCPVFGSNERVPQILYSSICLFFSKIYHYVKQPEKKQIVFVVVVSLQCFFFFLSLNIFHFIQNEFSSLFCSEIVPYWKFTQKIFTPIESKVFSIVCAFVLQKFFYFPFLFPLYAFSIIFVVVVVIWKNFINLISWIWWLIMIITIDWLIDWWTLIIINVFSCFLITNMILLSKKIAILLIAGFLPTTNFHWSYLVGIVFQVKKHINNHSFLSEVVD